MGGSRLTADNGMSALTLSGRHQLYTPAGVVSWCDSSSLTGPAAPTAFTAQGQTAVQTFTDSNGNPNGFAFKDTNGDNVSINTADMSIAYQKPDGSLLQDVDATGGEYIVAGPPSKDQAGEASFGEQIYVTPDGRIQQLNGNVTNLQVSQTGLSFETADHQNETVSLVAAMPFVPTGNFAAPAPPPPPPIAYQPPPPSAAPTTSDRPHPATQASGSATPAVPAQAPSWAPPASPRPTPATTHHAAPTYDPWKQAETMNSYWTNYSKQQANHPAPPSYSAPPNDPAPSYDTASPSE